MTVALRADQCPAIQVPASEITLAAAYTGSDSPRSVLRILPGSTIFSGKFNRLGRGVELAGRFGGGGYAVSKAGKADSFGLTATGSLGIRISAGQAMMDGPVEYSADWNGSATDNTRTWFWLVADGSGNVVITPNPGSVAPPAGGRVLLGSALAAAGAVSAVDTSGVMYLQGGQLVRYTADVAMPVDSPPSILTFWTIGTGGTWLWDGTGYHAMIPPSGILAVAELVELDSCVTTFPSPGVTVETYGSGLVVTTTDNADGSVTTAYGAPVSASRTTTFNADGSISVA